MVGHIMVKQLGKVLMKDGKMKPKLGLEATVFVICVLKYLKTIPLDICLMKNSMFLTPKI